MSGCSCVYTGDDVDFTYEHVSKRLVRPLSDRRCCECGEVIQAGERHLSECGHHQNHNKLDRDRYHTCLSCVSIIEEMFCDGRLYHGMHEALWDHLCEVGADIESDCLARMNPGARAYVCDMIEEYWDDHYDEEDD